MQLISDVELKRYCCIDDATRRRRDETSFFCSLHMYLSDRLDIVQAETCLIQPITYRSCFNSMTAEQSACKNALLMTTGIRRFYFHAN